MRITFDDILLDTAKHELWKGKERVSVEPQVFALIIHLINERHRVVSKDELIEVIWEGRFISDSAVSSRIKSARKVLGDDGRTQQYIKTLHGTGFRFIADIQESVAASKQTENGRANFEEMPSKLDQGLASASSSSLAVETSRLTSQIKPVVVGFIVAAIVVAAVVVWEMSATVGNSGTSLQTKANSTQPSSEDINGPASIAVLPFDDFSQFGDQEYLADGFAEELLNVLAQTEGLHVTSRTSAFAFKGRGASIGEIRNSLSVNHVLEGSVRRLGETLRITAQLIDARNDRHIWSKTYERALSAKNIFAVQAEISQAIVRELLGHIDSPIANGTLRTASTEAYDAYLRGRALIAKRSAQSIISGIAELTRAVTLDPNFALAHATLVEAYVLASSYAELSVENAASLAEPYRSRAMTLAPNAPETLTMNGRALTIFEGNDADAIGYFQRAIAANPNLADTYRFLGLAQSNLLRIDDAKQSFEASRRLDPLAPVIFANLFRVYWDKDDLDAMLALGEETLRHNSDSIFARRILGGALRESGNYTAAHRLFKDNEALYGASRRQLSVLYQHIGRYDLAAPYADVYQTALAALLASNPERAANMVRGGSELFDVAILRWAGDRDAAYNMAKADIARRNLLSPQAQIAARDQTYDIYYADLLREKSDPTAAIFLAKLGTRFNSKEPVDFRLRDSLYAGALWHMLHGDTEASLQWLDALVSAGHVWPEIAIEPLFDPIRNNKNFQMRVANLKKNAARHRAAIEAQLANPDDAWVTP
jgi:TolB-like protein/DNA-binding winged helix-turn-helix (wHTH) protein